MKLSIIVPVYNVEKYLDKCLDSLVNQTLDKNEYEIIVVNDGSPDHSQQIMDFYEAQYPNVVSLSKPNGGLSDARNYGIERAKGTYLAFVDSDDYVDVRMYETMLKKAEQGDFDMVVCDFKEIYPDRELEYTSRIGEDLITREQVKESMVDIYPSAWNKIYKKELFSQIRFKKNVWFEDVECLYRLFPLIHKIGTVREAFYFYIQREGSISKSTDERIFHCVDNWNGIVDYYYENNMMEEYRNQIEYSYVRYLYATFVKASLKYEKEYYLKAVDRAIKEVKKNFPQYRRNKYFYKSLKGIYCVAFNKLVGKMLYMMKKKGI